MLGLREDVRREVLGVYSLPEESIEGWKEVISSLRTRGMKRVLLFVVDEFKGIEEAIEAEYPKADIQRCIIHKKRNIIKVVRSRDKAKVLEEFDEVLDIDNPSNTPQKATIKLDRFIKRWEKIYPKISRMFKRKEEYFSYLKYPVKMRRMIYTNNWIENLNRQIRRTIKIRGAFPSPTSAEKLIILKCMEIEEHYMRYPVSSLLVVQDKLKEMFISRYKKPVLQTHKT